MLWRFVIEEKISWVVSLLLINRMFKGKDKGDEEIYGDRLNKE